MNDVHEGGPSRAVMHTKEIDIGTLLTDGANDGHHERSRVKFGTVRIYQRNMEMCTLLREQYICKKVVFPFSHVSFYLM
jgi:hypothetical protein